MARRWWLARAGLLIIRTIGLGLIMLSLTACLLISGETTSADVQDGAGNLLSSFVGAEGRAERILELGLADSEVQVIAIVSIESGDLELTLVQPDGSVAFTIAARPDAEITRSGLVRTNDQGQLRYQINARGARNGQVQLFFQP
jgi:hypothetical protein